MGSITEIFYAISSAALIPTELALLAALAIVCVMIGRTLRDAVERARVAKSRKTLDHALEIADNPQSARDLIEAAAKEASAEAAAVAAAAAAAEAAVEAAVEAAAEAASPDDGSAPKD